MRCVKTGFDFKDSETGLVHTGDLFVSDGEFFIRGIAAKDGAPVPIDNGPPDATVYVGGYDRREGHCDSKWTVAIEAVTPWFKDYIAQWYPELAPKFADLPEVEAVNV